MKYSQMKELCFQFKICEEPSVLEFSKQLEQMVEQADYSSFGNGARRQFTPMLILYEDKLLSFRTFKQIY